MTSIDTVIAQQKEVKVFAHRGGVSEFDENTIHAFEETYRKGIRGYETDIRMTKDGHLVIFHDDNFSRIVGIDGSVEEITLAELKKLRTKKGNPIPTVDEFLDFLKNKDGLYVEFEMKTKGKYYDEQILSKYCNELYTKVNKAKLPNSTYLFTSFDKRPLIFLKEKDKDVDLLYIKSEALSQAVLDEAKAMGISRIGCRVEQTTRDMVDSAKKQGFIVSLWPGKSVNDFLLGVMLGSDYLCTDVPIQVTEWVKNNASWITLK
ncbi:glycerophosphodiester phosphodiesterase [Sphingobacterium rhinopitheci]|nr:glycerophosphodiester phosphodiesterase [Sphingobacterium rhinopitheci]